MERKPAGWNGCSNLREFFRLLFSENLLNYIYNSDSWSFQKYTDKLEFGALAVRLPLPMGEVPAGRRGPSQSASLTALP